VRDLTRRRIRIAGLVGTLKPFKEVHVLDDLVGMALDRGSSEQKQFVLDAFHDRNGADAAWCLWFRDKDAALLGVRHISGNVQRILFKVEVSPLQAPDIHPCESLLLPSKASCICIQACILTTH